ncbi:hypothetical protein EI94DRAFT_1817543 [Lactarius quietus]|nr:hypothetical protein EI94DRAFT_1817543 [Lactarius quietus]
MAGHAREHMMTLVHQWSSGVASHGSSGLLGMAWPTPISPNVLNDMWQPQPGPSTIHGDVPIGNDTLSDIHPHLTPSRTANSSLPSPNHDVNHASTHYLMNTEDDVTVPLSDLFSAIGGSHCDGLLLLDESWIRPLHIDDGHDDDHKMPVQHAQPDRCTDGVVSSFLLGEDLACPIPSEEDDQDSLHDGDLNIDLHASLDNMPPKLVGGVKPSSPTYPWPSMAIFYSALHNFGSRSHKRVLRIAHGGHVTLAASGPGCAQANEGTEGTLKDRVV